MHNIGLLVILIGIIALLLNMIICKIIVIKPSALLMTLKLVTTLL